VKTKTVNTIEMHLNKGAVARPKNVRTEGLWAFVRAGLRATKPIGWIFGRLFFATFFWRTKESEKTI
jgi:hypothetical protein